MIGMALMARHHSQIPQDRLLAITACAVVAVGAATRGSVVYRIVATTRLALRTTTKACVLPFSSLLKKGSIIELVNTCKK